MQLSSTSRQTVVTISLTLLAAVSAAAVILLLFLGSFKIVVGLASVILFITALIACGNIRLFFLWGLILTAPLALDKSFMVIPHMGGAGAIKIEAMDIFMLPLLAFLVRDFYQGYRTNFRMPKVLYWWLALAFLGGITVIFGPMRQVALLEVVRMLKLALLFIVIVNEVVRIKQFGHIVAALMVTIAIQSIVGLVQYAFDLNLGAQILGEITQANSEYTSKATYLESEFTNRIGGLIGHPNLLAIFLAILLPIGISILFSGIKPIYKFLTSMVIIMGLISLVLTLSRSGWISFGVALAALMATTFILPSMRGKYVFGRILTIATIIAVTAALSGPIMKRINSSDEGAVSFRWEWMKVATEMALDKPVLGYGLNSFIWFMPAYTPYQTHQGVIARYGHQTYLPVVHNIYLLVWAEQGTVGLLLFLIFYFRLLYISFQGLATYKQPFLAMVNLGCLAGLLALSVDGLASFFIRNDNCGRIFFIVAALVVAIKWWHTDNIDNRFPEK